MEDFIKKLKWMPKDSILIYTEIYKILKANDNNSVTSYDIYESLSSELKELLTPTKITQRLETLKRRRIVQKTNKKITYIMDVRNNSPIYWSNIWKKFFDYLSEILDDASNNDWILNIVLNCLESAVNNSDNGKESKEELLLLVQQAKVDRTKLGDITNYIISCTWDSYKWIFKLYNDIFKDIVEKWLYNEDKNYWELKWQNTANKYKLL